MKEVGDLRREEERFALHASGRSQHLPRVFKGQIEVDALAPDILALPVLGAIGAIVDAITPDTFIIDHSPIDGSHPIG